MGCKWLVHQGGCGGRTDVPTEGALTARTGRGSILTALVSKLGYDVTAIAESAEEKFTKCIYATKCIVTQGLIINDPGRTRGVVN